MTCLHTEPRPITNHTHTCDLPTTHNPRHGHHCPDCGRWYAPLAEDRGMVDVDLPAWDPDQGALW